MNDFLSHLLSEDDSVSSRAWSTLFFDVPKTRSLIDHLKGLPMDVHDKQAAELLRQGARWQGKWQGDPSEEA